MISAKVSFDGISEGLARTVRGRRVVLGDELEARLVVASDDLMPRATHDNIMSQGELNK